MSPETREKVEAALAWIDYHYDNQDMNHVDFRVEATRQARAALALLREDDGWCYDMEKAPQKEWLLIASHQPDKFGYPNFERARIWSDGHPRVFGRDGKVTICYWATAWRRIDLPAPPKGSEG